VTLTADDLQADVEAMRQRGVQVGQVDDTTSDKVLFVSVSDPEGNLITLVRPKA
jgi:predicted enzyme related to lactoylglutathione lyase